LFLKITINYLKNQNLRLAVMSILDRVFKLSAHGTSVRTEITAGLTTFLTASYIIFVNPSILSVTGMDIGALTTVTCLVAGFATLLMAAIANAPIMMAPGMGLNAFFTYSLVLGAGISWETALGVVFISGILFVFLTLAGIRERIVYAIPISLRLATAAGIGLFIAFIGLQNLGLIVSHESVLVQLGSFHPTVLLGLFGLLLCVVLEVWRIKGALLITILTISMISIACGFSSGPKGFLALPPSPYPVIFKLDVIGALKISLWANIFAFMFVDLFDSLGTMLAVCREAGMVDQKGEIPALPRMLQADAFATVGGALLGTSTTTTYIESASGIAEGGRTGLTAVTTALLFFISAFFSPVIASVPTFATAPALIVVGVFMTRGIGQIDFYDFQEAVPAFLTFSLMPLSYSIANGLAFGLISYVLIKTCLGKVSDCDPFLVAMALFAAISLIF
jgi:AGZA family xanthine/uracil permease-like MFS transporter